MTLAAIALLNGWARLQPAGPSESRDRMRQLRARRYAAGLNATGRRRRNIQHPDLAGLTRRAYKTAWARQSRSRRVQSSRFEVQGSMFPSP